MSRGGEPDWEALTGAALICSGRSWSILGPLTRARLAPGTGARGFGGANTYLVRKPTI